MTLNNNLYLLFEKLMKDKKKSLRLLRYVNKLESKGQINNLMKISLIKSIIIIISFYPKKRKFIYKFIKYFYKLESDSKKNFIKLLKQVDFFYSLDLDDVIIDKIIFKTFYFLYNSYKINKDLPITLLNEILLSINKVKAENSIKIQLFLLLINKSIKIMCDNNKETYIFVKITELCGLSTKLINNFILR